jgi:hypothetical protein
MAVPGIAKISDKFAKVFTGIAVNGLIRRKGAS